MKRSAILFLDDGPWRLAIGGQDMPGVTCLEPPADGDLEQHIAGVLEVLQQHGLDNALLLLAVPSPWCAAASIETAGLPRKDRPIAMAYRMEEKLPIAAEQFSAGFIPHGGSALGVCVLLDKIKPIAEALESRGIQIHSVVPTVMLAAQQQVLDSEAADADVLIWRHDGWSDTITLGEDNREPVAWSLLPDEPGSIRLYLNMLAIQGRPARGIMLMGEEAGAPHTPREQTRLHDNSAVISEDPYHMAARCGEKVLAGQSDPWVDLKGSELGASSSLQRVRKPVKAVIAAAVLMLLCLNGAFLWRAHQYDNLADGYREQERVLYVDLYPGQPPPLAINPRLEGEYRKISGMRGRSESLPPPPVTMTLLHRVLNQLPDNTRFRVMELRIEDDGVYIDGQARSHGEVGQIAKALAAGNTLTIETRHTEQLAGEKGVGFVIVASPQSAPAKVTMK